mmetsp:Transcript_10688/g.12495  ORF Transcript_10688/g.12495 Transcript_10688/m.12495 type:complete len:226 (+) Transcript_10688:2537-3214(+)
MVITTTSPLVPSLATLRTNVGLWLMMNPWRTCPTLSTLSITHGATSTVKWTLDAADSGSHPLSTPSSLHTILSSQTTPTTTCELLCTLSMTTWTSTPAVTTTALVALTPLTTISHLSERASHGPLMKMNMISHALPHISWHLSWVEIQQSVQPLRLITMHLATTSRMTIAPTVRNGLLVSWETTDTLRQLVLLSTVLASTLSSTSPTLNAKTAASLRKTDLDSVV